MSAVLEQSESAILDRVFGAPTGQWSPAAAQAILQARFTDMDMDRMRALLEKAQAGELNQTEEQTLRDYERVGRILELMKSRARHALKASENQPANGAR